MEIITYALRGDDRTGSDQYYRDVAAFTDEVLAQGEHLTAPVVSAYRTYRQSLGWVPDCTAMEQTLEVLTLGTLWRVYGDAALELPALPGQLLAGLGDLRRQGGALKPGVDFLRGVLATLFLTPEDEDGTAGYPDPTADHLERLLDWLDATGEFPMEVRHLRPWWEYLAACEPRTATDHLATAITFAAWFESRSEAVLGRYTSKVEQFLSEEQPEHRWREDIISTGRRRVEYHLNMVGAEIMNRAFRESFQARSHKAVLLPGCMRRLPDLQCKANRTDFCMRCTGCTTSCRVHHLTKLGEKYGFDVLILPHESNFSRQAAAAELGDDAAIVGISCVLGLVAGGWKARALGLPAQCVLLDYCGCHHWSEEGFPMDMNLGQLRRVLGIAPA